MEKGRVDLLRDLEDVGEGDAATTALLMAALVERLIATHHRLNGRWMAKAKRRLADLATWDGEAVHLARVVLSSQSVAIRRAAARELAQHVLQPLGGLSPQLWESGREELQP